MDYLDTRWTKLKDYDFDDQDECESERKKFINSDEESGDEEWVQQLQKDYKRSSARIRMGSRWSNWTATERTLIFCLIISVLIGLLLSSLIILKSLSQKNKNSFLSMESGWVENMDGICVSEKCVEAAYHINQYVDTRVDACDDFYQFSCGKWLGDVKIPSGNSKWTSFNKLSEKNHWRLKTILDKLHPLKNDSEAINKAHMYYKACRDYNWIEKNGLNSLKILIKKIGSWGIWNATEWNDEDWSFEQALTKIHKLKSMPLFYMSVAVDDVKSNENTIRVEQSGITLPDEEYYRRGENDKVIKAYRNLMVKAGILLGGEKEKTEKEMKDVFEFEKKLASIYEPKERLRQTEKIQHKMTVEELQDLCPAIPWLDYMNSMFNTKVKFDEPIVVYTPHYLKNMSDLVIRTERRILANYMAWHLIKPLLPSLSKPFRGAYSPLLKAEKGLEIIDRSWRSCVVQTDSVFGFATGYLFVKEMGLDTVNLKEQVEGVTSSLKEAFLNDISEKSWMDEKTKQKAIEKVSSMINLIGYPDWIFDANSLTKYYENLTVTANPFKNYLDARSFYHQKTMNRRGVKSDRAEWHVTPTAVNAFYNSARNYIAFPSGILQSPFYSSDYPLAINFGAFGTILAHELTHGFDNHGRLFDKDGNLKNWWSTKSEKGFERITKCFEEQYSNFSSNGVKIDGKQTLAENIADNGGLKVAYQAFQKMERRSKKRNPLPGIPLNSNQLFFVSFAQVWCTAATAENMEEATMVDRHSPEHVRVLAAIANSKEFSSAFKCRPGSKMNPAEKCEIW